MTTKKLTVKQEAFCQAYVGECQGNKSDSYRTAYNTENMNDSTVWEESCKLSKTPNVATRLIELQDGMAKRAAVTADSIAQELEEARALAMEEAIPSAAVAASMGKAKVFGLLVDRKELTGRDGDPIEIDHNVEIVFNPVGVDD